MHEYLIKEVEGHPDLLFLGQYSYGEFVAKMEHLVILYYTRIIFLFFFFFVIVSYLLTSIHQSIFFIKTCFVPGMLAIGAKILDRPKDLEIAIKLGETCYWIYNSTSTGIGPEEFVFLKKGEKLEPNQLNALYSQWNDNTLPRGIRRMSGNYLLRPG